MGNDISRLPPPPPKTLIRVAKEPDWKFIILLGGLSAIVIAFFTVSSKSKKYSDSDDYYRSRKNYQRQKSFLTYSNSKKILEINKSKKNSPAVQRNNILNEERQKKTDLFLNFLATKLTKYPAILNRSFDIQRTLNRNPYNIFHQFRVMQWNGLAKSLCTPDSQPSSPKAVFDWDDFRKWRLLQEITRYNSDIICLQEADFYEDIRPYMRDLGYESVFFPKMLYKSAIEYDGCSMFYYADNFQLIKSRCENICGIDGEDHSQVFIITQLKHKRTRKKVTVVCVHLKAFMEYAEKRKQQTEFIMRVLKDQLLTQIDASSTDLSTHAVVVCGDFNGKSTEPFYEALMRNDDIKLTDAHMTNGQTKPEQLANRIIDYIFYTHSTLKLVSSLDVKKLSKKIPDLTYPSDHLSLVCDFQFLNTAEAKISEFFSVI